MAKDSPQVKFKFVPHKVRGEVIEQRIADGYINATAMCKAAGREFGHYNANATTKAFLAELSAEIGIPISALVQTISGGVPEHQGKWGTSSSRDPSWSVAVAEICGSSVKMGVRLDVVGRSKDAKPAVPPA